MDSSRPPMERVNEPACDRRSEPKQVTESDLWLVSMEPGTRLSDEVSTKEHERIETYWVKTELEYSPQSGACLAGSICGKVGLAPKRDGEEEKRGSSICE